jgi:uncharacterized protein (TIGR04222 family)
MVLGPLVSVGLVVLSLAMFINVGRLYNHPAIVGRSENKQQESDGQEISFILASVVMGFAGFVFGADLCNGRTRRGQSLLTRLRREHRVSETTDLALRVALYGIKTLQNGDYTYLKHFLEPPTPEPGPTA